MTILDNNFNSNINFKSIETNDNMLSLYLVDNNSFNYEISDNAKTLMFTDITQSESNFCLLTDNYLDIFDTLEDLENYRTENNLDDNNSNYFEIAPKQLNLGCLRLLQFIYENYLL